MTSLNLLRDIGPDAFLMIPLGIGNAFTRNYFNSCILFAAHGRTILVDAPAPLRRVMGDAEAKCGFHLDLDMIDDLFLTHLHGDHANGVEELGFWRMFASGHPKPKIHLLEELREPLWKQKLSAVMSSIRSPEGESQKMSLENYFDVKSFQPSDQFSIGAVEVSTHPTRHLVPTSALIFRFAGVSVGYSADSEFDLGLFEFFGDCQLIIHECGPGAGHTQLEQLMSLPEETRRKLHITHIPDDFDIENSPLPVLEEGRVYDLRSISA